MSDLVLSDTKELGRRIVRIKDFIFREIKEIKGKESGEQTKKLRVVVPFIKTYLKTIRLSTEDLIEYYKHRTIESKPYSMDLEFTLQEMQDLASLCKDQTSEERKQFKILIQLILIHMYPPPPYSNRYVQPFQFFQTLIQTDDIKKHMIASYFAATDPACAQLIYQNKHFLDRLFEALSKKNFPHTKDYIQFFINCIAEPNLKARIANQRIGMKIYNTLKKDNLDKSNQIIKDINTDVLDSVIELMKLLISGFKDLEIEIANVLMEDLNLLANKRDLNFVNKILVPVLRMEETIPVCICPYDSDLKRWILIQKSKPATKKIPRPQFFLPTELFSSKEKNAFLKTMKTQLSATNSYKKVSSGSWSLLFSESHLEPTQFWKFWETIQNQGPFIVILSGTSGTDKCTIGGYCSQQIPPQPFSPEPDFTANINYAEDNFLFYYTSQDNFKHFKFKNEEPFGCLFVDYENCGAFSIANDFILVSYSLDYTTTIGEIYQIECLEDASFFNINKSFTFEKLEIWQMKSKPAQALPKASPMPDSLSKLSPKKHPWHNALSPYNLFRSNPVSNIPHAVKPQQLSQAILENPLKLTLRLTHSELAPHASLSQLHQIHNLSTGDFTTTNGIMDIEYDIHEVIDPDIDISTQIITTTSNASAAADGASAGASAAALGISNAIDLAILPPSANLAPTFSLPPSFAAKAAGPPVASVAVSSVPVPPPQVGNDKNGQEESVSGYLPIMGVFQQFENLGGVQKLISVTLSSLKLWSGKELAQKWTLWLQELESFSAIPLFFRLFIKNKKCKDLLFKVLAGLPEEETIVSDEKLRETNKKLWENEQETAVKFSYQV